MYPSLVLTAALVAPAAPIPRDTVPNTPGPAPRVLAVKADASGTVRIVGNIPTKVTVTNTFFTVEQVVEKGQQIQRQVQKQVEQDVVTTTYFNKTLADFNGKFTTAAGEPLSLAEATGRVKNGATLLASADGKPVAQAWLRAVAPDTVVMVAEGLSHAQPQWGGGTLPTTPAPRLTMLGTNEAGKVLAPCTSQALDPNGGVYYDNVMFEGRGGRVFKGGFRGGEMGFINPGYNPNGDAKVVNKPLSEVKFDAYDVTGKLVPTNAALRKLAAGGMVIVAGDNRMPDENYLKAFHPDVLVLIGPDLVLPNPIVDQTKKKDPAKGGNDPKAQPAVDLPLIQPAIIKGRAGGNIILPAPAVQRAINKK